MNAVDKLLFITLLCLADEEGRIKDCDEDTLKELTHLHENPYDDDNDWTRGTGILKRLSDNGMITLDTNGDVIMNNWVKRQSQNLSGYERVKRWRDKQKLANKPFSNDNGDNANDNARIEENRIDNTSVAALRVISSSEKEEFEREDKPERIAGKEKTAYESLLRWAEAERGSKFVYRTKQYKALKDARLAGIKSTDLKERWEELANSDFFSKNGFDWTHVVSSFNRKGV